MQFKILHGFKLKSANDLLMFPGQQFETSNDEQVKELRDVFVKNGSCSELVPKSPEVADAKKTVPADPSQDLSAVKGVGEATLKKLNEKGITTVDQLKASLVDPAKEADLTEIFGARLQGMKDLFSK